MANDKPYFISTDAGRDISHVGQTLPTISEGLNSVRTFSWECHFTLPPGVREGGGDDFLTLAAKQVTTIGMSTEPVEVHRVNDRVYYPGKASREVVTITFDNLYQKKVANTLYNWFQSTYDPLSGELMKNTTTRLGVNDGGGNFKARELKVYHLDPHGNPIMTTKMLGVYPTSWSTAEFNYSTNEFHTIEMQFSFDFLSHDSSIPSKAN